MQIVMTKKASLSFQEKQEETTYHFVRFERLSPWTTSMVDDEEGRARVSGSNEGAVFRKNVLISHYRQYTHL